MLEYWILYDFEGMIAQCLSSFSNNFVRPAYDDTTLLHTIHFVTIYIIHSLPNKKTPPYVAHLDLPGIWKMISKRVTTWDILEL